MIVGLSVTHLQYLADLRYQKTKNTRSALILLMAGQKLPPPPNVLIVLRQLQKVATLIIVTGSKSVR